MNLEFVGVNGCIIVEKQAFGTSLIETKKIASIEESSTISRKMVHSLESLATINVTLVYYAFRQLCCINLSCFYVKIALPRAIHSYFNNNPRRIVVWLIEDL